MADPEVRKRLPDDVDDDFAPGPGRIRPIVPGNKTSDAAAPDVDRLQPIASEESNVTPSGTGRLRPLTFHERQKLPEGQAGTPEFYQSRLEKLEDQKQNPWGSPENHPGFGGRLAHVLSTVGNIAGDIVAPRQMEIIPGTQLHRAAEEEQTGKDLRAAETTQSEEQLRGAQTEEARARAEAARNPQPKPTEEDWSVVPNLSGPNGEAVQQEKHSGQMRYAPLETKGGKAPTQEQNKLDFQDVVGKLDKAGLATGPGQLSGSLDKALKSNAISAEEHSKARAYMAANPNAATNLTVHIAGQEEGQSLKDKNTKALVDDGKGGTVMSNVADAKKNGADFVPIKDEQTVLTTGHLYNQIRRSVDRLAEPRLLKIFDDPTARAIIATATSEQQAQHFGALVPGLGGIMIPTPAGMGKFLDSVLQNYKGTNKAELKEYLGDFWEAREATMNMMRLQTGGKQGARSELQMDAIIRQLPGGGTPDSGTAALQLRNMFANLEDYGRGVPDKLPGFEKYKAKDWSKLEPQGGNAGNRGEATPQRPNGVPDNAVWVPEKRQWQLPKT